MMLSFRELKLKMKIILAEIHYLSNRNFRCLKALIDLGADVNLIPLLVIKRVSDLDTKQKMMTLQMIKKCIKHPSRITKDDSFKV